MELFSSEAFQQAQRFELPNADINYYPFLFSEEKSNQYFKTIQQETHWQHDNIKVFGKLYKQPRLTAFFGEVGTNYSYSTITMIPSPFTPTLLEIKRSVEKVCQTQFNVVLLNLYRDGQDSNGWHSDDEKELGKNPVIASVSLGAKRVFQLRNKGDNTMRTNIELYNGSLLLMKGSTQHFWQHQIPKTKKKIMPRINLTFRVIH